MKIAKLHIILLLSLVINGCSSDDRSPNLKEKSTVAKTAFITSDKAIVGSTEESYQLRSQLVEQKLGDLEDYINLLVQEDIPSAFAENINEQIESLLDTSGI